MLEEKKSLAKHPFEIWTSEEVTELLIDFFSANFIKAGLDKNLAHKFVTEIWLNKDSVDSEVLRKQGNTILNQVKEAVKHQPEESDPLDIINLDGVSKFLDIGANKLATINYYASKYQNISNFIGVDIIPQRKDFIEPERCEYYQVDPEAKAFPVNDESIDLVNIQFVLHHFPDLASIRRSLSICQNIIKSKGRLVLWEETFTNKFDDSIVQSNNSELGIKTDEDLSERFYALDEQKRWEFIIVNDWLINVNNPHMPWTGQYYNWQEWTDLLSEHGFTLDKKYNLGLRVNGRLKQGVHMIGIFKKP